MSTSANIKDCGSEQLTGRAPYSWSFIREISGNVLLSMFFLTFAAANGKDFVQTLRFSSLLLLLKVSTDVVFYLIRSTPRDFSVSIYDWFIALAGTYAVAMFRPAAVGSDLWWGQLIQSGGMALQIYAMLSLNRSIGMVAANRGIKTSGMYRWIRHPLYLSYIIAFGGYVLNHPTGYNAGIYAAAVLLWVLRLLAEERFLMQDDKYRDYASECRWRLIPYVF
jgi:protein-S-isoprenylcysteine O-methyltransferase Ste14